MKLWTKALIGIVVVFLVAVIGLGIMLVGGSSSEASVTPPDAAGDVGASDPADEPTAGATQATTTTSTAVAAAGGELTIEDGTLVMTGANGEFFEIFWPHPGDTVSSPLAIAGATTGGEVVIRLYGVGELLLGEGSLLPDGAGELTFTGTFAFDNTCCTEMVLELASTDGLAVRIPLTYSEDG